MSKLDPILGEITVRQLAQVEDVLSNDDCSSDEEMLQHFTALGLTQEQATRALTYRQRYQLNIYLIGSTPIRDGDDARRFDPLTGSFENEITPDDPMVLIVQTGGQAP